MAIARFMYECDLQFYLANHPVLPASCLLTVLCGQRWRSCVADAGGVQAFKRMIRAVAVAGPSFQPPDADQITNLLTGDLKSRGKRGPVCGDSSCTEHVRCQCSCVHVGGLTARGMGGQGPRSQIAESQEARKDPAPM